MIIKVNRFNIWLIRMLCIFTFELNKVFIINGLCVIKHRPDEPTFLISNLVIEIIIFLFIEIIHLSWLNIWLIGMFNLDTFKLHQIIIVNWSMAHHLINHEHFLFFLGRGATKLLSKHFNKRISYFKVVIV